MIIRTLDARDLNQLRNIHEKFYKEEFPFPDFARFLCAFAIVDNDKIICAGGLKPMVENIIITNKDASARQRREALYQVLESTSFIAGKFGFEQVHAFINDSKWEEYLLRVGFKNCKGNALYLNL